MTKIAVDIALVFEKQVEDELISFSSEVQSHSIQKIPFISGCVPHLSLAMAFIPASHLNDIHRELKSFSSLELEIEGIASRASNEETLFSLEVNRTPELLNLHERAMEILRPYLKVKGKKAGFFRSDEVSSKAVAYVEHFNEVAFSRFWPHITIGYGNGISKWEGSAKIKGRVNLFHLGPHCSCWNF